MCSLIRYGKAEGYMARTFNTMRFFSYKTAIFKLT